MRRTIILIALTAIVALMAAPSALAAPGWSTPRSVPSAENGATDPIGAVDGQGRATVVWTGPAGVRVASERSPGELEAARTIGAGIPSAIVENANGEIVASWCDGRAVYLALGSSSQSLGQGVELGSGSLYSCADLAINARGDAVVAWIASDRVNVAFKPFNGSFGAVERVAGLPADQRSVGGGGIEMPPAVAVNEAGDVYVAWLSGARVAVARRPASGPLGPGEAVSPQLSAGFVLAPDPVRIEVRANGELAATWIGTAGQGWSGGGSELAQWISSGNAETGLSTAFRIASVPESPLDHPSLDALRLDIGDSGSLSSVSSSSVSFRSCAVTTVTNYAEAAIGAAPGITPIFDLKPDRQNRQSVAHDSAGRAFAAWVERRYETEPSGDRCLNTDVPGEKPSDTVRATTHAPGGSYPKAVDISDSRFPADGLTLNRTTSVTAAWTCFDGRNTRVQVATYGDTAGRPENCGPEDLNAPRIKVSAPRLAKRWRIASKPKIKASCHEQCLATTGLLLFSKGHRAMKVGVSEKTLKANKHKTLPFPEVGRGGLRAINRAVHRRLNVRFVYRLRFDDLAGNSRLKTVRVRLLP